MQLKTITGATLVALVLISLIPAAPAAAGELTATWNNGLKFADDEGNWVKLGGRVYADWAWFLTDDEYNDTGIRRNIDGTELRTARLFAEGEMHSGVFYKLQVDFAGPTNKLKDAYLGLATTPLFGMEILIGQFKQPISLEELTSSKYITFMERSQTAAFAPGRQSGIQLGRGFADERMTFKASVYRNSTDHGLGVGDGAYGFAGRLTGLVLDQEDGDLVHLGFGAAHQNRAIEEKLYVLDPEAHLQSAFGLLLVPAESTSLYDVEAAAVFGPFSVQGEYMFMANQGGDMGEDSNFSSWYAMASWFLTGESRPYSRSSGAFGRVKPRSNRGTDSGTGAFELAARYSSTDLNDGDLFQGGTLDAITVGANWYLNPNTRVMLNWVRSDGETPAPAMDPDDDFNSGVVNAIQTRFQVDF